MRLSIIIFGLMFVFGQVNASECNRLFYDEQDKKAALPHCLEEKKFFQVGYIYGNEYRNCTLMRKYYLEDGGPTAIGNLGINLLEGRAGCEQSSHEGINYIKSAIENKHNGYARFLGDYFKENDNKKQAIKYYAMATDYRRIPLSDWDEKQKKAATKSLHSILTFTEKVDLVMEGTLGREIECKSFVNYLLREDAMRLLTYLLRENIFRQFKANMCPDQSLYLTGYTYEVGLDNVEDLREAYRYYLIAGWDGNPLAKGARDRIRDRLSTDQINQAVCIAKYGTEKPNFYQKWRCDW